MTGRKTNDCRNGVLGKLRNMPVSKKNYRRYSMIEAKLTCINFPRYKQISSDYSMQRTKISVNVFWNLQKLTVVAGFLINQIFMHHGKFSIDVSKLIHTSKVLLFNSYRDPWEIRLVWVCDKIEIGHLNMPTTVEEKETETSESTGEKCWRMNLICLTWWGYCKSIINSVVLAVNSVNTPALQGRLLFISLSECVLLNRANKGIAWIQAKTCEL